MRRYHSPWPNKLFNFLLNHHLNNTNQHQPQPQPTIHQNWLEYTLGLIKESLVGPQQVRFPVQYPPLDVIFYSRICGHVLDTEFLIQLRIELAEQTLIIKTFF